MDPWARAEALVPPETRALAAAVPLAIVWVTESAFVAMVLLGISQPVAIYFLAFWTLVVGLAMVLFWRDFATARRQVKTQGGRKRRR